MKNFFSKIRVYVFAHKIISFIVLIALLGGGYWIYKKNISTTGETLYVLSPVVTGTIISSITGTGQVAALNQINIQPQVSGILTSVNVASGNSVGEGRLLFTIDDTTAKQAVTNAQASLQSAQISLNKLQVQNSTTNLNSTLAQGYGDGFSTVTSIFLDLPGIMSGLNDMFYKSSAGTQQQLNIDWYLGQVGSGDQAQAAILKQTFVDSYKSATDSYNTNYANYKTVSRTSDGPTIEALITQTYDTAGLISDTIKDANNFIDFVSNSIQRNNFSMPAIIATHEAILNTDTSKTNTDLQNLQSIENQIQTNKDAFTNSDLDSQSSQLSITEAQNSLQNAKDNLAYYSITAPFSGIIASVPVQKGQNVGSGTTLATIITSQQIATVSLNEVDVAKIKLGDKVTVTFDAIPGLSITGKVSEIDSIGTVSQGVVNYSVQISFDANDSQVKPGMSINAAIITNVEQNVLTVPNSAVKTTGSSSYVQMFDPPLPAPLSGAQGSPSIVLPRQQPVTVGISDNTSTEILSGLNVGDKIVTRTIAPTTAKATTAPSILGGAGGRGGASVIGGAGGGARTFGR